MNRRVLLLLGIVAVMILHGMRLAWASVPLDVLGTPLYLPIILRQPTPTATPPPTSTPLPTFRLLDGYYEADLPNNGSLWFTVTNNGSLATNGGFYGLPVGYFCTYHSYDFNTNAGIAEGRFTFYGFNLPDPSLLARMSCTAISITQASCTAREVVDDGCQLAGTARLLY